MNCPTVSICTITFNRRPFINYLIKCIEKQTYSNILEWIIIDDGTDPIEDLVCEIPNCKYFFYPDKMSIGRKRNISHEKCSGDIICYFDDDDYYPPERISHGVQSLLDNPRYRIAGSSKMYIYYPMYRSTYSFGPYSTNHSTAATFIFWRDFDSKYDETSCISEEKTFLCNYTIPLFQLDTEKTIIVFSHIHNSFDKRELLQNIEQNKYAKNITDEVGNLRQFFIDTDVYNFYVINLNDHLLDYKYGYVSYKPDVTENIERLRKERIINAKIKHYNALFPNSQITKKDVIIQKDFMFFSEEYIFREFVKYEENIKSKQLLIDELFKKIKNIKK